MTATAARTGLKTVPTVDWDPYAEEVLANPLPFYKKMLDAEPIVLFAKYGVYGVAHYDVLREVVIDYRRFTANSGVGLTDARDPGFEGRPPSLLVEVDPPQHTATRREANAILSPPAIRKWRWLFEQESKSAIDRIIGMREFDGVKDLVEPIMFNGFPEAMGIRSDADAFRGIRYMLFNQSGPRNDLYYKGVAAGQPYQQWLIDSCQRENVKAGSIADQFFQAESEGKFLPGTAANIVRTLVRSGTDTTMSGVTHTLLQLAKNPAQWKLLKENPDRVRFVFDEGIRLEAPNHVVFRCTTTDCELAGYELADDTKIGTFPTAANRDPRKWTDPDTFDIMRNTANVHMSFGAETHNCIGQNIARMEAECILRELVSRIDAIELTGDAEYILHNQLRMIGRLPLRVTPA